MRLSGITKQKIDSVVGLDIEAGSVAATELRVNGSAELKGAAIAALAPGSFREGEVQAPDALAATLKELFAEHKLGKRVRLGVGNQRVVVRTLRLPAIEDRKEMEAAVRFQAQEQMPMPLDQAVLEHQVVGGVPAEEGQAPQVDVIVVAARRDMVSLVPRADPAGRARAGRGRSLRLRDDPRARRRARAASSAAVAEASRLARSSTAASATSPTLRSPAAAPASSPAFPHAGLEPPTEAPRLRARAQPRARDRSGSPTSAWSGRRRRARGRRRHRRRRAPALGRGRPALLDELRLSLDYYGAQEAALPVERIVLCGPGSALPASPRRWKRGSACRSRSARPDALAGFDESAAARLTVPFGLALEE